jgi:hypothetical protein
VSAAPKGRAVWEAFADRAYYDLWCVRRVTERGWGQGYHLHQQQEAEALKKLLEEYEWLVRGLRKQVRELKRRHADAANEAVLRGLECDLQWQDMATIRKIVEGGGTAAEVLKFLNTGDA